MCHFRLLPVLPDEAGSCIYMLPIVAFIGEPYFVYLLLKK